MRWGLGPDSGAGLGLDAFHPLCVQADVCMAGAEGEEAGWAWRPLGEERQNLTLLKQDLLGGCMDCRRAGQWAEWEQEACGEAVEEPTGKGVVCLAWGP